MGKQPEPKRYNLPPRSREQNLPRESSPTSTNSQRYQPTTFDTASRQRQDHDLDGRDLPYGNIDCGRIHFI